jgi:hypothetical protein
MVSRALRRSCAFVANFSSLYQERNLRETEQIANRHMENAVFVADERLQPRAMLGMGRAVVRNLVVTCGVGHVARSDLLAGVTSSIGGIFETSIPARAARSAIRASTSTMVLNAGVAVVIYLDDGSTGCSRSNTMATPRVDLLPSDFRSTITKREARAARCCECVSRQRFDAWRRAGPRASGSSTVASLQP